MVAAAGLFKKAIIATGLIFSSAFVPSIPQTHRAFRHGLASPSTAFVPKTMSVISESMPESFTKTLGSTFPLGSLSQTQLSMNSEANDGDLSQPEPTQEEMEAIMQAMQQAAATGQKPQLTPEQEAIVQAQQEEGVRIARVAVDKYLKEVFDDDRTVEQIHAAPENVMKRWVLEHLPRSEFAEVAYYLMQTSPETQRSEAVQQVMPNFLSSVQTFLNTMSQVAQAQEQGQGAPLPVDFTFAQLAAGRDLYTYSNQLLQVIKRVQPEVIQDFHDQQFMQLNERLQRIVVVNYVARGVLNNDMRTQLGKDFNMAYAYLHEIGQKMSKGEMTMENILAQEFYLAQAVMLGEEWFLYYQNKELVRFTNDRTGVKFLQAENNPKQPNTGILHFQSDDKVREPQPEIEYYQGKPYKSLFKFNEDSMKKIEEAHRRKAENEGIELTEDDEDEYESLFWFRNKKKDSQSATEGDDTNETE